MSDLKKYIEKRKKTNKAFAEGYEEGYEQFKIGVILRQARESAGLTQEELALRLKTKKTAISRIENHAEDIKLSTLERVAKALGKRLQVQIAWFFYAEKRRLSPNCPPDLRKLNRDTGSDGFDSHALPPFLIIISSYYKYSGEDLGKSMDVFSWVFVDAEKSIGVFWASCDVWGISLQYEDVKMSNEKQEKTMVV